MRLLVALLALVPVLAFGQGIARNKQYEQTVLYAWRGGAATAQALAGKVLPPGQGVTIRRMTLYVSAAAGTATGTMVIRVWDHVNDAAGNNACTWTIDCTTTDVRATGEKTSSALTGTCTYPGGTSLGMNINGACGTAQPSVLNIEAVGVWR